jgi:hypothetical protein
VAGSSRSARSRRRQRPGRSARTYGDSAKVFISAQGRLAKGPARTKVQSRCRRWLARPKHNGSKFIERPPARFPGDMPICQPIINNRCATPNPRRASPKRPQQTRPAASSDAVHPATRWSTGSVEGSRCSIAALLRMGRGEAPDRDQFLLGRGLTVSVLARSARGGVGEPA